MKARKSKLGGNKEGLGLHELMTARERIYLKALAAIDKNDFNNFSCWEYFVAFWSFKW